MKKSVSEREIFDAAEDCRGQRPLEASVELCEKLDLHDVVKPAELLTKCGEKLQWDGIDIPDMPGAVRLLEFLKRKKVPMALATSTSRKELEKKMKSTGRTSDDGKHRGDLLSYFDAICCGDEVAKGKPDPEIFHLAMERLGVKREDAGRCLVFEDTPHGVSAAKAAGCCCVAVPSLRREKFDMYKGADRVYHSLMDIELEDFGLPKFEDWKEVKTVEFVKEDGDASLSSQTRKYERFLKLDAFLELTGPVIRGFGRGSKMLGIPTANLDVVPLKQQIDKLAPGIYFGFAKISSGKHKSTGIHRTVMSIGYNPFFNDKRKSIEPWLLREFEEDFYDETLSVLVCAYVRAECNFTTVENLIERIRKDARVCEEALDLDLVEGLDSWKHWFEDDVDYYIRVLTMSGGEKVTPVVSTRARKRKVGERDSLWDLVVKNDDISLTHIVPRLNATDVKFLYDVNSETRKLIKRSSRESDLKKKLKVREMSSISTLEVAWENKSLWPSWWDETWFCWNVAQTNKLELLKWAREEKKCEWDIMTINMAASQGNLEMVKYCVANECPIDERACAWAARCGHLEVLKYLREEVKAPWGSDTASWAAGYGRLHILEYLVEREYDEYDEYVYMNAAMNGHLDCLRYLHETAKAPWDEDAIRSAHEENHPECVQYLLDNNCPLPWGWRYEDGELHVPESESESES
ncbi:unnamed protein product [Bathycoccus prasinos]